MKYKKLVVLLKGKSVLSGNLLQIKKDYCKKNIHIVAENVNFDDLQKVNGVLDIIQNPNEIIVKIENHDIVKEVFEIIKQSTDVSKFVVEDATLNEIFLEKVGVLYDK